MGLCILWSKHGCGKHWFIDTLDVTKPSHPLAQQQTDAVDKVLEELDVASIPKLVVWNKVKE